jgi:hypothetical protein
MKLTTTFNLLREKNACETGYKNLAKHLGGVTAYGKDVEIDLLTILESNGFDDAVWCLRATVQDSDNIKRIITCDFAESVLHIFESKRPGDDRPRKAIEAARGFIAGSVSREDMQKARAAANEADAASAYAAAAAAAYAAVYAAADYEAVYAADAAVYAYAAAAVAADAAASAAADAVVYAAARAAAYAADAAYAYAYARKAKKEQLAEILRKHLSDDS